MGVPEWEEVGGDDVKMAAGRRQEPGEAMGILGGEAMRRWVSWVMLGAGKQRQGYKGDDLSHHQYL